MLLLIRLSASSKYTLIVNIYEKVSMKGGGRNSFIYLFTLSEVVLCVIQHQQKKPVRQSSKKQQKHFLN